MNFTIASFDLNEIGRGRCSSITCKVKGYWSSDTIRIYIQRGYSFEGNDWKVSVSYGSGGRDTKEVVSDTEAARYFAQALVAMCNVADSIMEQKDVLEAAYEQQRLEYKAEFEAEKVAKQAKIDADEEVGVEAAEQLIKELVSGETGIMTYFNRGTDNAQKLSVVRYGNTTFYKNSQRISKKEAIQILASSSARILQATV